MKMLLLFVWALSESSDTFELAPKNAVEVLPTVTNSKADRKFDAPVMASSIAFFSG